MLPQKVWTSHPTSDREMPNLPPEIWSNILSFLSNANFDTFFRLKQVSHLFNQELKKNLPDMSWLKIDNIETKGNFKDECFSLVVLNAKYMLDIKFIRNY